jgi:hypothetical protein
MDAIYIDFECLKKPPGPILLGILKDLRGQQTLEQLILDDSLKSIPGRPERLRHASLQDAAAYLVAEADANDCKIVGWSFFDRDVFLKSDIPEPLKVGIRRRYENALTIAKPWKAGVYPRFKIVNLQEHALVAGRSAGDCGRSQEPSS